MSWIIKIIFRKSCSSVYNSIVKQAQGLPNYSCLDGVVTCGARTIREYISHHTELEDVFWKVEKWKSSRISLYDKEYSSLNDFWDFQKRVEDEAGRYAPLLKNSTVGMDSITLEDLPYPIVYYPSHYGAFFAFAQDIDTELFFCECEKEAIENYIKLRKNSPLSNYIGSKTYPLGSDYFPAIIAEQSQTCSEDPLSMLRFEHHLCHRCNNKVPRLKYCLDMYSEGNKFKQAYGWFVNQEYFKHGIDPYQQTNILKDKCPPEILDYVFRCAGLRERLSSNPENQDILDEIDMYSKEFHNSIENLARESLGFKKKGETWVSETILARIVKGLYPNSKVIMHHRPKWLEGLELDIYLPEHSLAFEYQGIQHFIAVDHWGGKTQLKKQQEHDERKKTLCKKKGIVLICIDYDDPLTEGFIRGKIDTH